MKPDRIEILGVPVDCVTMASALDYVDELVRGAGPPAAVIAVNPEKVMKARADDVLLGRLRGTALLIPDGIGVVAAARFLGLARIGRVPGVELMEGICARGATRGYRVFLLGARPEVNAAARAKLAATCPGLAIAGGRDGYFTDAEAASVVEEINASGADVLFVALGSPRQENFIAAWLPRLRVKVCQGVGGSFDVLAGTVRRAPAAWRRLNLEWAYRLLSQPQRLLRQTALPRFAWHVLGARFRGGRAPR